MKIEQLVEKSVSGDKQALEAVVNLIQKDIYNLSLRMLANPDHALDATQDILIKIITSLSSFKNESLFKTWMFE